MRIDSCSCFFPKQRHLFLLLKPCHLVTGLFLDAVDSFSRLFEVLYYSESTAMLTISTIFVWKKLQKRGYKIEHEPKKSTKIWNCWKKNWSKIWTQILKWIKKNCMKIANWSKKRTLKRVRAPIGLENKWDWNKLNWTKQKWNDRVIVKHG